LGIDACAATPITPGVVTFDATVFKDAWPAFTSVPDPVLVMNFEYATLLLANSCCGLVKDAPTRAALYDLVVAHITALLNGVNGQPGQGIVGRISNATEGSVSVSAEFQAQSESAAWWNQTQYGAMYWRATAQYRTATYFPPACAAAPSPWDAWPQ